jgi:sigma-B regulation protein RsbU (phosphoserine phosphatase)
VAGDYYDFPAEHPDGAVGLVIADVTDKGMPAALFMALTRSIVRASAAATRSPAEAITQSNRLICADSMNSMFVTLFFGRLDPATGDLTYVNAGHNPPLWREAGRAETTPLTRTGMALGIHVAAQYEQRTVRLAPGDWYQWSRVHALAGAPASVKRFRAVVRRTSGDDTFLAYGVLNDAVTSDGSYQTMIPADTY